MRAVPLPTLHESGPAGVCELLAHEQHLQRVVHEGIAKATVSVDIMTADLKAMLIPERNQRSRVAHSILHLLAKLAQGGVEIRLLHAGVPSSAALAELRTLCRKGLPENLTLRRCPRLHAKAVIIDASAMYLGSANLTGAGLGAKGHTRRNFELGLWTTAPALIDATLDHFNALWEGFACETCGRRDVCPEPLEEPAL